MSKEARKKAARNAAHYSEEAKAYRATLTLKTELDAYNLAYARVITAAQLASKTVGPSKNVQVNQTVEDLGHKLAHEAGVKSVGLQRRKAERDKAAKVAARAAEKAAKAAQEVAAGAGVVVETAVVVDVPADQAIAPLTPGESEAIEGCFGAGPVDAADAGPGV